MCFIAPPSWHAHDMAVIPQIRLIESAENSTARRTRSAVLTNNSVRQPRVILPPAERQVEAISARRGTPFLRPGTRRLLMMMRRTGPAQCRGEDRKQETGALRDGRSGGRDHAVRGSACSGHVPKRALIEWSSYVGPGKDRRDTRRRITAASTWSATSLALRKGSSPRLPAVSWRPARFRDA